MNERELLREYGIVRVEGYVRCPRLPKKAQYVRSHYRSAPGMGPLGEP